MKTRALVWVMLWGIAVPSFALEPGAPASEPPGKVAAEAPAKALTPEERRKRLSDAIDAESVQLQAFWAKQNYAGGVRIMEQRVASPDFARCGRGTRIDYYYSLACGASLLGRKSEAVAYLGAALAEGWKANGRLANDHVFDALREDPGYRVVVEFARFREDHLKILQSHAEYARTALPDAPVFRYQSKDDPNLVRLRELYQLESVAGSGDDTSRLLRLLHWVHTQVRHDGPSRAETACNAISLLEYCRTQNRGINCRMMATILNEACLSLGYKSRHITCLPLDDNDGDCHVITTVWLESAQKWVYLDPTFEAYFKDAQGSLLSVAEVRAALINGDPLKLAEEANWNGEKKNPADYLDYMAKNLVRLESPRESAFGYESRTTGTAYVELDPVRTAPRSEIARVIHQPEVFWAKPGGS